MHQRTRALHRPRNQVKQRLEEELPSKESTVRSQLQTEAPAEQVAYYTLSDKMFTGVLNYHKQS